VSHVWARSAVSGAAPISPEIALVNDILYVLGSVAFFALMLAYVRACEALGRSASPDAADTNETRR
jgi:hypothetical protein